MTRPHRLIAFAFICCAGISGRVLAADAPKRPWTDAADFGLTMTTGNSENTNLSFGNKFKYTWSNAELNFDALALHNEATVTTRTNVDGVVTETDTTATTAATYALGLKYKHDITPRFYWLVLTSWYQNFFAGVDDRYAVGAGVGYKIVDQPRHLLKGEAGVDFTREDPLGDPDPLVPGSDALETKDYASLRLFLGYEWKISDTAKLTEDLNFVDNLDTTSDWRVTSITAVTASMTSNLAIKVSYTVLYDNEPAVQIVPDTVGPTFENVTVPYEKTDTILAAALVVNF